MKIVLNFKNIFNHKYQHMMFVFMACIQLHFENMTLMFLAEDGIRLVGSLNALEPNFNLTSLMILVTQTDRPKSAHNHCVIKVFVALSVVT